MKLILASQSKSRAELLRQLGIPFTVQPANVDETPLKNEAPLAYVKRIAMAKAAKISAANPGSVVLAADTPVIVGRRILQTPETPEEAAAMVRLQSGRRVHIPTVVVVVDAAGKTHTKTVDSWLKIKRLSEAEIQSYLATQNWNGSGGIDVHAMQSWIQLLHGSVTGIIGLPLYETAQLFARAGIRAAAHKGGA